MSQVSEKHTGIIRDAVERLFACVVETYGLRPDDVLPRIERALGKYLFVENVAVGRVEIEQFIAGIRGEELCLIEACERGDEGAWRELSSRFDSAVRSAARRIAANSEEADDLANSIWADLYGLRQDSAGKRKSKLAYYSGRGSLAGWLRAVATQIAVDNYRKQSRLVQIEENSEFEARVNEAANADGKLFSHIENPESILINKSMKADVSRAFRSAIAELDPEDRLVLKLYYFDNLKLKEIGAAFGYHEATASRKLTRIHKEIRKSVEKLLQNEHGWSSCEITRHLSETAENLGISIEKMIGLIVVYSALQEFWSRYVP